MGNLERRRGHGRGECLRGKSVDVFLMLIQKPELKTGIRYQRSQCMRHGLQASEDDNSEEGSRWHVARSENFSQEFSA